MYYFLYNCDLFLCTILCTIAYYFVCYCVLPLCAILVHFVKDKVSGNGGIFMEFVNSALADASRN